MIWILFVDDDQEIRNIAKTFLQIDEDFVVDTIDSGKAAVSLLYTNPYQAIISDYDMPDMDGITFLKKAKSLHPDVPFIIYTGQGDESTAINALNSGADFYLKKEYHARQQFLELAQIVKILVNRANSIESLKKSEEKFRTIAEYSNEWMYWITEQNTLVYVSPSCEPLTGYSREEFYQNPNLLNQIIYNEDKEKWDTHHEGSISEKKSLSLDVRIVHKDGSVKWIGHVCQSIYDEEGLYRGRRVSNRDITVRKKIEEQLLHERNNFLHVFQAAPVGLLLLNTDTEITHVNKTVSELVLRDPADIIGERGGGGLGCIHSLEAPQGCGYSTSCPDCPLRNGIESVIRKGISVHGAVMPLTLSINMSPVLRWIRINAEPVDIQGVEHVIVAVDDITDQRLMEDALRESEEHYRSLFENMLEGYAYCQMLYDDNGKPTDWIYLNVNNAFEKITGLTNVIGRLVSEVIPGVREQTPELFHMYNQVVETGIPGSFEIDFTPLKIWLKISAYRPKIGHFVVIFENITERKQAKDALITANHKLNLLSGITRHDIRNELQLVFGYLEMAISDDLHPKVKGYLNKVNVAAHHIDRQLAFTRDYQNIGMRSPVWHDINAVITGVVNNWETHKILFHIEISGIEVYADPLIEKVFHNLIDNAIQYGEKITLIRFFGVIGTEGYTIICEDDGVGIPERYKSKIFNREYYKHTGFGLNLSREILDITGITIKETGEPGRGARFEMLVPIGKYQIIGQ